MGKPPPPPPEKEEERFDFDAPLWDQSTYVGRWKYFAWVTDPRLCILTDSRLEDAKTLREQYKLKEEPPGTTHEQLVHAKRLYESAFHPDTGDKMNVFGRMAFQVPGGMLITGAMLTWYRTVPALVFWQWVNQSFNALVNYTNRNANSPLSETQMGVAYVSATAAACATAIGLKKFLTARASPLMQRFVPFAAVAAANCVNIPLMRQNEIIDGVGVMDSDNCEVGHSSIAAVKGISQVVLSRIVMCAPGMLLLPFIMERLERNCRFRNARWAHAPFQTLVVGCCLLIMVPTACAIFPQKCSLKTGWIDTFESKNYAELKKNSDGSVAERVYFNKGL